MTDQYPILGVLQRLHGYQGEFILVSGRKIGTFVEDLEQVFLMIDGIPVPFFIDRLEWYSDTSLILGFDQIQDKESAMEFLGTEVLYPYAVPREKSSQDPGLESLVGYTLVDVLHGEIGKITGILYYSENVLFEAERPGGRELLIPVHPDIILEIDKENRSLRIQIPEGLLDLF